MAAIARSVLGALAVLNTILSRCVTLVAIVAGVIGTLFFDNPRASYPAFLGVILLLAAAPVALAWGTEIWSGRLQQSGKSGFALAVSLVPLLVFAAALTSVVLLFHHQSRFQHASRPPGRAGHPVIQR